METAEQGRKPMTIPRPGLLMSRDRVGNRCEVRLALKAAEKLGQAARTKLDGGGEQPLKNLEHSRRISGPRESHRRDTVVMRPDRAVVVAHRIVPPLA